MSSTMATRATVPVLNQGRFREFWQADGLWSALERLALVALGLAALCVSAYVTWSLTLGFTPTADLSPLVRLLMVDAALLLGFGGLFALRLWRTWQKMRAHMAGSQMLRYVTGLFSAVAIVPTALISIFAILVFNLGLQAWFSEPVSKAISEAESVARSYLVEHSDNLMLDAFEMANDINRAKTQLEGDAGVFSTFVDNQAFVRELDSAVVISSDRAVLAQDGKGSTPDLSEEVIGGRMFSRAALGEMVMITDGRIDQVQGIIRLQAFEDAYLYLSRAVDAAVVSRVQASEAAARSYNSLEDSKAQFQTAFLLIFVCIGFLLLLGAVGFGFFFATSITRPIAQLIGATDRLGQGDFTARVAASGDDSQSELARLSSQFNKMAGQLDAQQQELRETNDALDSRRQFTEAVLSGVSTGVIGLDRDLRITLPNSAASALLKTDLHAAISQPLAEVLPELATEAGALIQAKEDVSDPTLQREIALQVGDSLRTFLLTVVIENTSDEASYILNLDDITALQRAQRTAAWSDVAQRIAHEIKNPLTPIQLSAERLKRRYAKQIMDGRETFDVCTDTIIRQVGDIGRMVDEFSKFAKTPTPKIQDADLTALVQQAAFLQSNAGLDVKVTADVPDGPVMWPCDEGLVSQAVVNILKNACEAVETRQKSEPDHQGRVHIRLIPGADGGAPSMVVVDSGLGIPENIRDRLTEPYVTTRTKGTGLGLAIVKKIFEDHNGELIVNGGRADDLAEFSGAQFEMKLG